MIQGFFPDFTVAHYAPMVCGGSHSMRFSTPAGERVYGRSKLGIIKASLLIELELVAITASY